MANDLVSFDFKGATIRLVKGEDGKPWFVAQDVCTVLGLRNVSQAVKRLKLHEKGISRIYTLGGDQDTLIVSRSGLYKLVMRSNREEAIEFQDWVAEEVLISIDERGFYVDERQLDKLPLAMQEAYAQFKAVVGREPKGGITVGPAGQVVERQGTPIGTLSFVDFKRQMRRR